MKIVEYKVVESYGEPYNIITQVNMEINAGWEPIGGVQVIIDSGGIRCVQSMVRKE